MCEQEQIDGPSGPRREPKCGINRPHTLFLESAVSQAAPQPQTALQAGFSPMLQCIVLPLRVFFALFLFAASIAHAVTRGVVATPNVAEQLLLSEAECGSCTA